MIPARGNYTVRLAGMDDKQVEAWDDDGNPLVVGRRGLVPASSLDENYDIAEPSEVRTGVAALPGGGWRVKPWRDGEQRRERPVFAWLVDESGWIWPATMEDDAAHAWVSETRANPLPPENWPHG